MKNILIYAGNAKYQILVKYVRSSAIFTLRANYSSNARTYFIARNSFEVQSQRWSSRRAKTATQLQRARGWIMCAQLCLFGFCSSTAAYPSSSSSSLVDHFSQTFARILILEDGPWKPQTSFKQVIVIKHSRTVSTDACRILEKEMVEVKRRKTRKMIVL